MRPPSHPQIDSLCQFCGRLGKNHFGDMLACSRDYLTEAGTVFKAAAPSKPLKPKQCPECKLDDPYQNSLMHVKGCPANPELPVERPELPARGEMKCRLCGFDQNIQEDGRCLICTAEERTAADEPPKMPWDMTSSHRDLYEEIAATIPENRSTLQSFAKEYADHTFDLIQTRDELIESVKKAEDKLAKIDTIASTHDGSPCAIAIRETLEGK